MTKQESEGVSKARLRARYWGGAKLVELGDRIETVFWYLFKTRGVVVYIPGVSAFNSEFEHDDLQWIGVKGDDGSVFGEGIELDNGWLGKRVTLLERAPANWKNPIME